MPKNKETALATAQKTGYLQLADTDFGGLMAEELDGLDISFERIKIPSAGSTVFEMPGEDSDESDALKEFSAVILHHHPVHAYYKDKYTGGNSPPDCGSFDGIVGVGDPGGDCKSCRNNQFGTGENGSKACKNRRRIFLLREGDIFPLILSLPTGSLRELTRYLKRLLSKGKKSNSVVTKFSLKKVNNNSGIAFSQAQFTMERALTPDEYALIEKLSEQVKGYSQATNDYDNMGFADDVMVDPDTGEVIEALGGN